MARVRMQDIANQVGVSAVTVHNALAGRKGCQRGSPRKDSGQGAGDGIFPEPEKGRWESARPAEHRRGHLGEISGGLYHVLLEDLYGDRHGGA